MCIRDSANTPQAKGRVERANQTLQDRLVKEMRLQGISDIETANAWLPEFIEAVSYTHLRLLVVDICSVIAIWV